MGLYHITYIPELKEVCLYLDGGCNLRCHGCITDHYLEDYHLNERREKKNPIIDIDNALLRLLPLSPKRAVFLGKEPTMDNDFSKLLLIMKHHFFSYNIFLTNGYRFWSKDIDEVCVSIKAVSSYIFKDFTGRDCLDIILHNFIRYSKSSLFLRAESLYVPDYIEIEEIGRIAKFISNIDPKIPYRIDAYIPYKGDRFRRPTEEEMVAAMKEAKRYLLNVRILHWGMGLKYIVERVY